MLIQVTVNNPDDQDVAVELVGLLYQQSMILTILALYLINMRSKQPMILEANHLSLIVWCGKKKQGLRNISLSNFWQTISSINWHHFEIHFAVLSKVSKSKARNCDRNISYNDDICM